MVIQSSPVRQTDGRNQCTDTTKTPALTFRLLEDRLTGKYGDFNNIGFLQQLHLIATLLDRDLHDLSSLNGYRILDLGCGSPKHRSFKPWLCRALYETEAVVIGIDGLPNVDEKFEHHQLNMMSKGALANLRFKKRSFDLINMAGLLNLAPFEPSEHSEISATVKIGNREWHLSVTSAQLMLAIFPVFGTNGDIFSNSQAGKPCIGMFNEIAEKSAQLLKEDGFLIVNSVVFQRKNDDWVVRYANTESLDPSYSELLAL